MTTAHLVHHGLVSSAPTPSLGVKTLMDVYEVATHVARDPEAAAAITSAVGRAGLGAHLGRLALALELVLERPLPVEWGRTATPELAREVIASCAPTTESELRAQRLRHRLRALWTHPLPMKTALVKSILLPARGGIEEIYGLRPGSPWVWPAYLARSLQLTWRAAADLWVLGRARRRHPPRSGGD